MTLSPIKTTLLDTTLLYATLLCATLFLSPSFAHSKDAAKEIARKVFDRDRGKSEYSKSLLLSCQFTLKNGKRSCAAAKRKKELESVSLLSLDGKVRSTLNIVTSPAKDKGIAFLQKDFEKEKKDSHQWMYLPSLYKAKRIVSEGADKPKTGTLFGSEIAYEDIEKTFLSDYSYSLKGDEKVGDLDVFVLESIPSKTRQKRSSYAKNLLWVDKTSFITVKSEHYNHSGQLIKSFFARNISKEKGVYYANMIIVVNHENKRMSMMKRRVTKLQLKVPAELLSQRALTDAAFRASLLKDLRE